MKSKAYRNTNGKRTQNHRQQNSVTLANDEQNNNGQNQFSILLDQSTKSCTESTSFSSKKRKKSSSILLDRQDQILPWNCPNQIYTPLEKELSLIPLLIRTKNENGMFYTKSRKRIQELRNQCQSNSIPLLQALSLRRHHIKLIRERQMHDTLGLGSESNIRQAAALFESCISTYMDQCNVSFLTEKAQRKRFRKETHDDNENKNRLYGTPDFLFEKPVNLKGTIGLPCVKVLSKQYQTLQQASKETDCKAPIELHLNISMKVNWLEAKMFYGASTIPNDGKSAVGKLLCTAEKYVTLFGPGVMVFAYGCGEDLASKLYEKGVLAMDASPCDLSALEEQQRTWCADAEGNILI